MAGLDLGCLVWGYGVGEEFILLVSVVVILPCGPEHSSDGFKSINQSRLLPLLPACAILSLV